MSRFKNEVVRLESHIKTLRAGYGVMFGIAVLMGFGWWDAPRNLTIHNPPDLRSGSTRNWWEIPPEIKETHTAALPKATLFDNNDMF